MQADVLRDSIREDDPHLTQLSVSTTSADMSMEDQHAVLAIAQEVYYEVILAPTNTGWRKEGREDADWSRKMVEREVERTSLRIICEEIKRKLDEKLGKLWHVVYGRDFAAYVTYETLGYMQFSIDGADVLIWRHGR